MNEKLISLLLFLSLSLLCLGASANNNSNKIWDTTPSGDNILYVNAGVVGGDGSGSSWVNAMPSLAEALRWARTAYNNSNTVFDTTPLKIYVAKGAYLPAYHAADGMHNTSTGRNSSFVLVKNVQLYGGFDPANGIDDLTKTRIYGDNGTILSGNIGNGARSDDNVYHVVIATSALGNALLNGFSVKGGYSFSGAAITVNGESVKRTHGAGIYIQKSSPVLTNVIISGNEAYEYGGGIYNQNNSSPILTNVTISGNSAYYYGGGIYNEYSSSPVITNSIISGNSAMSGGGIYNYYYTNAVLTNVVISGNSATSVEGYASFGGGIYNEELSSPVLTNVTISGNTAFTSGGGIYNQNNSNPQIRNSIIFGKKD